MCICLLLLWNKLYRQLQTINTHHLPHSQGWRTRAWQYGSPGQGLFMTALACHLGRLPCLRAPEDAWVSPNRLVGWRFSMLVQRAARISRSEFRGESFQLQTKEEGHLSSLLGALFLPSLSQFPLVLSID